MPAAAQEEGSDAPALRKPGLAAHVERVIARLANLRGPGTSSPPLHRHLEGAIRELERIAASAARAHEFTETLEDGIANMKITSPGVWMVCGEKRLEANAKDPDVLSLKAALVFSVQ